MTLWQKWMERNSSQQPEKRSFSVHDVVTWFKGRDTVAWFLSLGLHFLLLFGLAAISLAIPQETEELALAYSLQEALEEEILTQEFFVSDEPMEDAGALSQAGDASSRSAGLVIADQSLVVFEQETITDFGQSLTVEVDAPIFQGLELTNDLPSQGLGSKGTSGAVGAIDLITEEIRASVEQRPTLVVWLFDQSGSLREERKKILKRFRGIYDQLGIIEASANPAFEKEADKPLLTAVVGFGEMPVLLTPEPTDRIEEIEAAIEAIEDDETGKENVFRAVSMVAKKYRSYRLPRHGDRNVMIIVFTDESGDDLEEADATISYCRKQAMPVYVVGRPAPLGREKAFVKWIDPDPKFDQRPQWVPVSMGPETVMLERLKLRFLHGSSSREAILDSGHGPFALTRLCFETNGMYYSSHPNRAVGRHVGKYEIVELAAHITAFFDPKVMRRYQPDYVSVQEYQQRLSDNRARRALVEAAQLSWTSPIDKVRTKFPKRNEATLAEILSRAQRTAADSQPKIDQLLRILSTGESDREKIVSPRWQAGYDLAIGRVLAMKVRADGYNTILARAKQGMAFQEQKNNTWILVADDEFDSSSLKALSAKAKEYLERVVEEHPDTPWAWLANRELQFPLGWRWKESYTVIPELVASTGTPPPKKKPKKPAGLPRRAPPLL